MFATGFDQLLDKTVALSRQAGDDHKTVVLAVEGLLEEVLTECPYLEVVYLVDLSGSMISFVVNRERVGDRQLPGSIAVGQSYADRPWFQAVNRDERSAVTPIYDSLLTGDPCFTIAVAVHDREAEMIGTLGVDVNLRNWTQI